MKLSKIYQATLVAFGCLAMSNIVKADFSANMSRIDGASGSGHTVVAECGGEEENNYDSAIATIENSQSGGSSRVKISVSDAIPNTLFTVWVRLKGKSHGQSFGGSPISGGGATPLAPSSSLDELVTSWTNDGDVIQPNGFTTNHKGNGRIHLNLDFPLEGGAYPFNNISTNALASAEAKRDITPLTPAPTAIADPRQNNVGEGAPFLIRVVSHCQDGLGHGLSPGNREAWFQYP